MKTPKNIPPSDGDYQEPKKGKRGKKVKKDEIDLNNKPDIMPHSICQPIMPPELSEEDRIQIEQITQEVNSRLEEVIERELKQKTKKSVDIVNLKNMIGEFCDTFMVIGYNFDGDPFVILNANTPEQSNALAEHLRITFINTYKPPLF